jgi:hypothetical protein
MKTVIEELTIRNLELELMLIKVRNFLMLKAERFEKEKASEEPNIYDTLFRECCDVLVYKGN